MKTFSEKINFPYDRFGDFLKYDFFRPHTRSIHYMGMRKYTLFWTMKQHFNYIINDVLHHTTIQDHYYYD